MTDIVITWPKSRTLDSYVSELDRADRENLFINYKVPSKPKQLSRDDRCYMVHDGAIRGFNLVVAVDYRNWGEVARVESDPLGGWWPEGWYIVREPKWYPIEPIPMAGFRGYTYWPSDWPIPEVERTVAR